MSLENAAEFGGGVSLDQPGSGQQAGQERLKLQQELIHDQPTRPSHSPVQSRQRVGRCPTEAAGRAARLLLLQALDGLPAPGAGRQHTSVRNNFTLSPGKWTTFVYNKNYLFVLFFLFSARVSLEDDAVADGGQQVVEVELVLLVARIPAMLLPRFHQSFSKPDQDHRQ